MSKRIIVFDFDGVVCDSTDECMVTSWNAWETWNERSDFRYSKEDFPPSDRDSFKLVRPFVRGAGEYYVIRRCLEEKRILQKFDDYEVYCRKWSQHFDAFKQVFYAERESLRRRSLTEWIGLHSVWPKVTVSFSRVSEQDRAYIATLKDRESVKLILESQGLEISDARIFDYRQIRDKVEALDRIREIEGCGKNDMIFLDDNVTHLSKPIRSGYTCYLTTWGNVPEHYVERCHRDGVPCLDLTMLHTVVDLEK